jgi:hypothetical protein
MDTGSAAVFMQHPRAQVKGKGHVVRPQAQPMFSGEMVGLSAHVVQVVAALFELVLQCHEISCCGVLWAVAEGARAE